MRVYFVSVLEPIDVIQEYIDVWARTEPRMVCGLAYAVTTTQARVLFTGHHDLEHTHPLHIQKVAMVEDCPPRYEPDCNAENDALWAVINWSVVDREGVHYA